MRASAKWLLAMAVFSIGAQRGTARAADDPVVARMQKYYDSTRDLQAHFEQTLETAIGGKKKAAGEVRLKKPGRMRWDYLRPEKKLLVSDGATLWVFEPEDAQAFKQDLRSSTLPVQVSFLVGQGRLADEFEIARATASEACGGDVPLKLVPKQATAAYRYLVFCVDEKSGQVKRTVVHDQQQGTNTLTFTEVKQNGGIDDTKFRFSPPPGTKILGVPQTGAAPAPPTPSPAPARLGE